MVPVVTVVMETVYAIFNCVYVFLSIKDNIVKYQNLQTILIVVIFALLMEHVKSIKHKIIIGFGNVFAM